MLRRWLCQADVAIVIEPVDPILVKSGHATMDGADMVPVSTFRGGKRIHYLPGSSLKGVLRSHLERIARTLRPGSVCLPYHDPNRSISIPVRVEQQSYGCGFRSPSNGRTDAAAAAYADSCAACRLFGSLNFGGRFSIGDAYPLPEHEPNLETRNGVGIDRFTGGTVRGVLFDLGTDQITAYFLYTFSETRRATPPRHRTLGVGQGSDVRARLGAPGHASTGEGG